MKLDKKTLEWVEQQIFDLTERIGYSHEDAFNALWWRVSDKLKGRPWTETWKGKK